MNSEHNGKNKSGKKDSQKSKTTGVTSEPNQRVTGPVPQSSSPNPPGHSDEINTFDWIIVDAEKELHPEPPHHPDSEKSGSRKSTSGSETSLENNSSNSFILKGFKGVR